MNSGTGLARTPGWRDASGTANSLATSMNSGVNGLVLGGSHILAYIPSMPAMLRRRMVGLIGLVNDISFSPFSPQGNWQSGPGPCPRLRVGAGGRPGDPEGASGDAQHHLKILIQGEIHKTGGIPVPDDIHSPDQAGVVVAALGSLGRLRMVVGRVAQGRLPLGDIHV